MDNAVMVPVNYMAVVFAAISSLVVGFLWYGPLFGKMWIKEMGWSKADVAAGMKKNMAKSYGIMFVGSLLMAFIMSHVLTFASAYLHESGLSAGLQTGFWNWLGFVAPITLSSVLFEGKSVRLWLLNNGYNLITFLVMGSILALWV
ncbi:MAG: DUF1761 domain-containing protein [Candidatus Woesebacteria bacterium]